MSNKGQLHVLPFLAVSWRSNDCETPEVWILSANLPEELHKWILCEALHGVWEVSEGEEGQKNRVTSYKHTTKQQPGQNGK